MRKLFFISFFNLIFLLSGAAFAKQADLQTQNNLPGTSWYAGLQLGYANLHYDKDWLEGYALNNNIKNKGFSGRINFGFAFNQYLAAEAGAIILPRVWISQASFRQTIVDVLLQGTLPLKYNFALFGKVGPAVVTRGDIEVFGRKINSDTNNKLTLALGGGINYHFNQHWLTDLSYLRYFGRGDLKPTDFVALGFAYRF